MIDAVEFYRAFPDATEFAKSPTRDATGADNELSLHKQEAQLLRKQNELLIGQLRESGEREKSLLDTLASSQRLLEHQKGERKRFFGLF